MARDLDIAVYGCTGDAGRAICAYLARVGGATTWALAGRNEAKLRRLREKLGVEVEIVVADAGDAAAMRALAARCRVVATAAGPYAAVGEACVRACVAAGTHYCDVTGEVHWVEAMARAYPEATSCLVSFAGYDCVPNDACVFACHRALGEPLAAAECVADFGEFFEVPRGTALTAFEFARNVRAVARGVRAFGGWPAVRDFATWALPSFHAGLGCFTLPCAGAVVNIPVVHRSARATGAAAATFRLRDRQVFGFCVGRVAASALAYYAYVVGLLVATPFLLVAVAAANSPLAPALRRVLQGRSTDGSPDSTFRLWTTATGATTGATATAYLAVKGDMPVVATAALCAETALALVDRARAGSLPAGFRTPAALGDTLIDRLKASPDMTLEVARV